MNLYEEFYPLAVEMLDEFGAAATLTATAPAASSLDAKRAGRALPVTGQPSSRPTRAVVAPSQIVGVDGRTETRSVATMLAEPFEGETLVIGTGKPWIVGTVTRVAPQGQAIVFMAQVS
ncbi:hypothetical protein IFT54_05550 [Sphingomonas sp. CFBP 13714]|uniref:hypothetical protein n=1 Tax=Sphingomonas sp. CFBP 13714 TaxID=2775308 RepID=UPI00177E74E8|nr:hypothetical protein [Sphingomonas sp. CFBP 13714]MBD8699280.1 hypothetical protein [Sphingomonas sp. CFBP 13714]